MNCQFLNNSVYVNENEEEVAGAIYFDSPINSYIFNSQFQVLAIFFKLNILL